VRLVITEEEQSDLPIVDVDRKKSQVVITAKAGMIQIEEFEAFMN
jgi:hypothetical protein